METLPTLILAAVFLMPPAKHPAIQMGYRNWCGLESELARITDAAINNGISYSDDLFLILCAIRKAENGADHLAFGIKHPKAQKLIEANPRKAYQIQAGWAAATVRKNWNRYQAAGKPGNFVEFLGRRWCPKSTDPVGHKNWIKNVNEWFLTFRYQL